MARTLGNVRQPKLIACDIDGTLLDPASRVSPRTAAVVRRAVAAEVPFVLVTGRPARWVVPVVDELGHAGLAVCSNGAVLYDAVADRVLDAVTLAPEVLVEVAETLAAAVPGCQLAVERPTASGQPDGSEFVAEHGYDHPWEVDPSLSAPRHRLFDRPAIKMLVRRVGMASQAMADTAVDVVGDAATVTFSTERGLVELSAPGVSKGTALARVAERFGVAAADVIAFGDMANDVPMLRWAGHGVAMANAHRAALDVADEVTGPNTEDGVALVLERWF